MSRHSWMVGRYLCQQEEWQSQAGWVIHWRDRSGTEAQARVWSGNKLCQEPISGAVANGASSSGSQKTSQGQYRWISGSSQDKLGQQINSGYRNLGSQVTRKAEDKATLNLCTSSALIVPLAPPPSVTSVSEHAEVYNHFNELWQNSYIEHAKTKCYVIINIITNYVIAITCNYIYVRHLTKTACVSIDLERRTRN